MEDNLPVLGGVGAATPGPWLECMANDYLENSLKKQSQASSLLFLGEIRLSVSLWKNAQSLHSVTLKERKFPNEKKNKSSYSGGKWDHFHCFRKTALLKLSSPAQRAKLFSWNTFPNASLLTYEKS